MSFRQISIIILLILNYSSYSQQDSIVWQENRPLTWKDFRIKKKKTITSYDAAAIGFSLYSEPPTYDTISKKYKFKVYAVEYPDHSWSIKEFENNYGLLHEQIHFDIAKLFAIKTEEVLNSSNFSNANKYRQVFDSMYNELMKMERKYDKEAGHGIIVFDQKIWEIKIRGELQKY